MDVLGLGIQLCKRAKQIFFGLLDEFGGAAAAYSLFKISKTYNGPIVRVRRDADNAEREFTSTVQIADWVNGKQETALPCDIPANPQDINRFTASGVRGGVIDGVYRTNTLYPTENGRIKVDLDTNSNVVIRWTGSQWLWEDNDEDEIYWTSSEDETYPWDVTSWTKGPAEVPESTGPVFSNFVGGRFDNSPVAAYSLRKVKAAGYTGDAVRIRRASDDVEVDVAFDANDEVSTSSAITNPESIFPTSVAQNRTGSARYDTFTTDGLNSFSATCTSVALGGYIIDEGQTGDVVTVSFDATINSGSIAYVALRADIETGGNASNLSSEITSSGSYSFDLTATGIYSVVVFVSNSGDFTVSNVSIIARPDQGDTTTTTLGAFLAEELTAYSSDFTTTDGWFGNKTTITANVDEDADGAGVPPSDDFLKMVADGAASPPRLSIRGNSTVNNYVVGAGGGDFEVTFDYYAPQDISTFKVIVFSSSGNPQFGDNDQIVAGSGSWSATVTLTEAEAGGLTDFRVGSTTDQTGKTLYIKNLQIKRSNHNATVATWYDQEGSNHATQGTAASQPKIAEGGSLLTEGIGFDGVDDFFETENSDLSNLTELSLFTVLTPFTGASQKVAVSAGSTVSNSTAYGGWTLTFNGFNDNVLLQTQSQGSTPISGAVSSVTANESVITSILNIPNGTTSVNSTEGTTNTSMVAPLNDSPSRRKLRIGCQFTFQISRHYQGSIKEVILYDSDQSDNRFKIESNINNHYGIYTAAEDGFVNTWYDQSGNSNDAVAPADVTEPKIVNAGSLINNGKSFSGANVEMLTLLSDITLSNEFSIFYKSDFSARSIVLGPLTGTEPRLENVTSSRVRLASGGDADFDNGVSAWGDNIFTLIKDSSNDITLFENGTSKETVNKPSPTDYTFRRIFSFGGNINVRLQGEFSELVIYNSDQSANRTAIESNIANRYGITLP